VLIDSHCHLNFLDAPDDALTAAREAGVHGFLCIGVDAPGRDQVLSLAAAHSDVWASVGWHPESVKAPASGAHFDWIDEGLRRPSVVAVGETGLDYYQIEDGDAARRRYQQDAFDAQLSLARERRLPVVVHTRGAEADTRAMLRSHADVQGVLHCFTESWALAEAALDLGWYVSMSGIVTFRNASNVREVAERIPLDRLLVETDAPWLAPVPKRGKTNEPAYVVHTARFLAELRGISYEELAAITTENFHRLFARTQPA
jgi:TatD DNase family protein